MNFIHDYNTSKPKMYSQRRAYVWEVIQYVYDDYGDENIPIIKAVFFDPWKAVDYQIKNYGIFGDVKLAIYDIKSCVAIMRVA